VVSVVLALKASAQGVMAVAVDAADAMPAVNVVASVALNVVASVVNARKAATAVSRVVSAMPKAGLSAHLLKLAPKARAHVKPVQTSGLKVVVLKLAVAAVSVVTAPSVVIATLRRAMPPSKNSH
jgi:hypothetical protein